MNCTIIFAITPLYSVYFCTGYMNVHCGDEVGTIGYSGRIKLGIGNPSMYPSTCEITVTPAQLRTDRSRTDEHGALFYFEEFNSSACGETVINVLEASGKPIEGILLAICVKQ